MEPILWASAGFTKKPPGCHTRVFVALVLGLTLLSPLMAGSGIARVASWQPSFHARTVGVRVDVLVQHRGRVVTGLTRDQFRLWDNNREQRVGVLSTEAIPVDLVVVYDTSESVEGDTQARLRSATRSVVAMLRSQDRAGLVAFSDRIQIATGLTPRHELLAQPLASLQSGGRTRLRDAIFAGLALSINEGARPLVLVLSDGTDTGSWLDGVDLLAMCERTDATVYVVLMGDAEQAARADRVLLADVARQTGGRLLIANSSESVSEAFEEVLREFNGRYVLSFSPEPATTGWHTLRVSVARTNAKAITARRGYWLEK